jgi:hypothetical protein
MDLPMPCEPQPSTVGVKDGRVGVDRRQDGFFGLEMVLGNVAQWRRQIAHRFSVYHASLRTSVYSLTVRKPITQMSLGLERMSEEIASFHFPQTNGLRQTRRLVRSVACDADSVRYTYRRTPLIASLREKKSEGVPAQPLVVFLHHETGAAPLVHVLSKAVPAA